MMTEQYKESYQNKYRKEIAQVHAPQSLIERTKAAVRAEEERILRERAAKPEMRQPETAEPKVTYADYVNYGRKFSLRKWTYPLTAAAAVLILASVSMTMRGLKSSDMAPAADTAYSGSAENGAVYEAAADNTDYEERAMGEAAAEAAEAPMMEPTDGAVVTESAAEEAPAEDRGPAVNGVQKAMSAADDKVQNQSATAGAGAEESEAEREEAVQEKKEAKEDSLADMAADKDSIIVEKVEKRPAFCDLPDAKTCVYEENTFIVRKEKAGWVAYAETENGERYLFRGEMEEQEEFLEAVSQALVERITAQDR